MSKPIAPSVFALKAWTIKKHGDKFYIIPSAAFGLRWSKSYDSLQSACMAVSRKLAEEWTQRNERRRTLHRPKKETVR